ncbi:MAG: BatD family protein [Rhodanobacter sp.]
MSHARIIVLCLFALLLVPAAHAAQVSATLDRDHVQLGDTVTLNIRVEGATASAAMPDLRALQQDFSILGTSQNSSLSVENGKATSSLTFGIALRPLRAGSLQIPSLQVAGERTAPLSLQVDAQGSVASAAPDRDVFMEATAEPQRGYVGEQFSYVVKLFYAGNLSGGSIDVPDVRGAALQPLGKDIGYDTQRGGRSYHVLERRYALIPQQAGRLEIPAASFQGSAVDPYDPGSFFGATNNVSASAAPVAIEVQAAPAHWGNKAWLPARALSLTIDGWPDAQQQVRVGQPLNLTMTLRATGLSDDALPSLSLPPLDGATVYPDKPVNRNHVAGQWTVGEREQAFAIVPERAGTLTIPATTVTWWNVLTDKQEVAQIPARSIEVLPAIGGSAAPPSSNPAPAASVATAPTPHTAPALATPWRWIALGSIALWLLSLLAWWLWHRRSASRVAPPPAATPSNHARQARRDFMQAARGSDAAQQLRCLLAWARTERPQIQHPGELSAALDDAAQRAAIDDLQRRRYAGVAEGGGAGALAETFKRGFAWRRSAPEDSGDGLPPLYPFKLR